MLAKAGIQNYVMLAKAGIQKNLAFLGSRPRGNDEVAFERFQ